MNGSYLPLESYKDYKKHRADEKEDNPIRSANDTPSGPKKSSKTAAEEAA